MRSISIVLSMLLLPAFLFATEQNVTVDVKGNCRTCKKKIEKAANSVSGVGEATWDKDKKKLTLVFDDAKTSKDSVVSAILKAGYDADGKQATDDAYNALPDCCQYRD